MTDRSPNESTRPSTGRLGVCAYAVLLALFFLWVAASFLPEARLWGINHLAFYPVPVRLAAFLVVIVSFLPPVERRLRRWWNRSSALMNRSPLVLATLLSVASVVLFLALASKTQLLGDGQFVTNNIEEVVKADPAEFVKALERVDRIYPGTDWIIFVSSRIAANVFNASPLKGVQVVAALLGALLVFFVVLEHRRPRRERKGDTPGRAAVLATGPSESAPEDAAPREPASSQASGSLFALAFLSGGIQIFFGYIEAYAPLMFFTGLFLLTSYRTVRVGAGVWRPVLCVLAAVGMHLLGLILVPSLCFLLLWVVFRRRWSRRLLWGRRIVAVAAVVVPAAVVQIGGLRRFILPLFGKGDSYGVLSVAHFVDLVNETLLLFPAFAVVGAIALFAGARGGRFRRLKGSVEPAVDEKVNGPGTPEPWLSFGMLLALPCALFVLVFKPELGMARDWDLFALTAVGMFVPLSGILERIQSDTGVQRVLNTVLPPALVLTAVLTAAWIGINAHPARSVARYESILSYDRTNPGYAYEVLASHYHTRGDPHPEIRALEKAVEASPNPRYLFTLGARYFYVEEREKAVATLERCLRIKPDYDRARQYLVQMLYFMGRYDDVLTVCEEGARMQPQSAFYAFFKGKAYLKKDEIPQAVVAFDECARLRPPPEIASELVEILRSLKR